jgi:DNA polymerase-3 subunit beta
VKSQRTTLFSRLVEGRYPQWRDVFPSTGNAAQIEIMVGPFYSAVRQAAIVTTEERRGVNFTFGDGKVVLAGHGAEMGESHVELPIPYDGPEVPIKLDPRFVGDFLRVLDPEQTFTLNLRDSESAVVCTTADGYAYVIMPLSQD